MLRRSLVARTPLWSLESNSLYLEKEQFLCEGMGLLRTCSMHWRRVFPFFTFSGYSFLLSESQKSSAETRGVGDKKGQFGRRELG